LAHRTPVDAVTLGQRANREALDLAISSDLLELLHS
jgi:hypothetical protein